MFTEDNPSSKENPQSLKFPLNPEYVSEKVEKQIKGSKEFIVLENDDSVPLSRNEKPLVGRGNY